MTPDLPEHPTDLTPEQRTYLVGLRLFLVAPPTEAVLVRKNLPRTAALTVALGGLGVWAWALGEFWAAWFAGGMLFGLVIVTASNIARAVRLWPATAAVVDWGRLDALLGEPDPDPDRP